jgi:hypothetical protein
VVTIFTRQLLGLCLGLLNKRVGGGWQMGINHIADMTVEEASAQLGGLNLPARLTAEVPPAHIAGERAQAAVCCCGVSLADTVSAHRKASRASAAASLRGVSKRSCFSTAGGTPMLGYPAGRVDTPASPGRPPREKEAGHRCCVSTAVPSVPILTVKTIQVYHRTNIRGGLTCHLKYIRWPMSCLNSPFKYMRRRRKFSA